MYEPTPRSQKWRLTARKKPVRNAMQQIAMTLLTTTSFADLHVMIDTAFRACTIDDRGARRCDRRHKWRNAHVSVIVCDCAPTNPGRQQRMPQRFMGGWENRMKAGKAWSPASKSGHRPQQPLRVGMLRPLDHRACRALFDDLAA